MTKNPSMGVLNPLAKHTYAHTYAWQQQWYDQNMSTYMTRIYDKWYTYIWKRLYIRHNTYMTTTIYNRNLNHSRRCWWLKFYPESALVQPPWRSISLVEWQTHPTSGLCQFFSVCSPVLVGSCPPNIARCCIALRAATATRATTTDPSQASNQRTRVFPGVLWGKATPWGQFRQHQGSPTVSLNGWMLDLFFP